MASRIGIELSASHWRIVEVHVPRSAAARRDPARETRVLAFRVLPCAAEAGGVQACAAQLRRLFAERVFSRRAPITAAIWGLPQTVQFMRLPPAAPADLDALARREARHDIEQLILDGDEASVGIAIGGSAAFDGSVIRREVSLVATSGLQVRERLRPLIEAGLHVDAVVTPALALASIAGLRRGVTPASLQAYVAFATDATAVAIVRDGLLMFAREIPWGHASDFGPESAPPDREQLARRLAVELRRSFLFFKQKFRADVEQVNLCGDLPQLRMMTAPLIAALDIEVETLDAPEGIDLNALPPPDDEFRERLAELRLAWGSAADHECPINLLPAASRPRREARRQQLALAAGLAAAVGISLAAYVRVDASARASEQQVQALTRQVAELRPRVQGFEEARRDSSLDQARRAALQAFDTQGVRLARALEVIARAAPPEIVLTAVKVTTVGPVWRATLSGIAMSADPGPAQAAVNAFLRQAQTSVYLGPALRSPLLRIMSGREAQDRPGSGGAPTEGHAPAATIPAGMSGIEFTVEFEVRK